MGVSTTAISGLSNFTSTPSWFVQQNLPTETHYTYVGYGSANSMQAAKQIAREDLSNQLFVVVETITEAEVEVGASNNVSSTAKHSSRQETYAELNDVKVVKSELLDRTYYVALQYQHISIIHNFIKKLNKSTCESEEQHPYLVHTPLFKELNEKLPCKLNIELLRKNRSWVLAYKDNLIQLNTKRYNDLYIANQISDTFEINTPSTRLQEGERFHVAINSNKDGYVTLFNVYADGIVTLLQENVVVKEGSERKFPLDDDGVVFEAGILDKGRETVDLYIGLYSDIPVTFSRFNEANATVQNSEWQYQFDYLLQLMKQYEFSVVLFNIFPLKDAQH